jgi:rhamnulokinase
LKYRVVLDELRHIHSPPIRKVHIIGGGVKNKLLCQFTANATGIPVYAGPTEATSIGNIMMQALTLGVVDSVREMREVISRSFELSFYEPEHMSEWDRAKEQYLEIIGME